jgi:hypothetical protein
MIAASIDNEVRGGPRRGRLSQPCGQKIDFYIRVEYNGSPGKNITFKFSQIVFALDTAQCKERRNA